MGATEVLTAVLVVITGFYAWQNYRMANEMRAARGVAVLPKLSISLGMVGPQYGFVYLTNVGPGAALDVDIGITFVPHDEDADPHVIELVWTTNVMAPGETHSFIPRKHPDGDNVGDGEVCKIDELTAKYRDIRLMGTYRDALGTAHRADDTRKDLDAWWDFQKESGVAWRHPDPDYRFGSTLADRLHQKFSRHNRTIEGELTKGDPPRARHTRGVRQTRMTRADRAGANFSASGLETMAG
jgi:hypothetical protein